MWKGPSHGGKVRIHGALLGSANLSWEDTVRWGFATKIRNGWRCFPPLLLFWHISNKHSGAEGVPLRGGLIRDRRSTKTFLHLHSGMLTCPTF